MALKLLDLIFLTRPILLIPVWTIFLHSQASGAMRPYLQLWPQPDRLVALAVLTLIAMGAYVLNQIFDIATDLANDKLFLLSQGIVSRRAAWICYGLVTLGGIAAASLLLRSPIIIGMVWALALAGILYSAPGIRLKDRPIWGMAVNASAYGIFVPLSARPDLSWSQAPLATGPYFLAVAAAYILTTIPDRKGDAAAGKQTVAVRLGSRPALYLALGLAGACAAVSACGHNWGMTTVALVTIVLIGAALTSARGLAAASMSKIPIMLLTVLAGSYFPLYFAVVLLTIVLTRAYYKSRFGIVYPRIG